MGGDADDANTDSCHHRRERWLGKIGQVGRWPSYLTAAMPKIAISMDGRGACRVNAASSGCGVG